MLGAVIQTVRLKPDPRTSLQPDPTYIIVHGIEFSYVASGFSRTTIWTNRGARS
jgi:hypothetical protein